MSDSCNMCMRMSCHVHVHVHGTCAYMHVSQHAHASARAGRTANMEPMYLTLDVLKLLSGWLNTVAACRVKGRAYDAERGAGWEAEECACGLVAAQADRCARGAGSDQGWGGQVTSGAHVEHVAHVRDRGGVEDAERLVE